MGQISRPSDREHRHAPAHFFVALYQVSDGWKREIAFSVSCSKPSYQSNNALHQIELTK